MNGILLQDLGLATGHADSDSVEFFRKGAPAYGALPACGVGLQKEAVQVKDASKLRENCADNNRRLLQTLRESEHSARIYEQTLADAEMGRMTKPRLARDCDLTSCRLNPSLLLSRDSRPMAASSCEWWTTCHGARLYTRRIANGGQHVMVFRRSVASVRVSMVIPQ